MPARDSKATEELSDALHASMGSAAPTARMLERYGERGLLKTAPARGLGRGAGSTSRHGLGELGRAEEAARLVMEHKSLDAAVLVLFMRGQTIDKDKLEAAYVRMLSSFERWLQRGGQREALAADTAGRRLARNLRKWRGATAVQSWAKEHAASGGRRAGDLIESAASEMAHVLITGRPRSQAGLEEFLDAFGVTAITHDRLPDQAPPLLTLPHADLRRLFHETKPSRLIENVKKSRYEQIEFARDDVLAMVGLARAFTPVAQELGVVNAFGLKTVASVSEFGSAMLVPAMIVMRRLMPDRLDEFRVLAERETPRFIAIQVFMARVPRKYHVLFGLDAVRRFAQLPEADQAELRSIADAFERECPAHYAALDAPEQGETRA